MSGERNGAHLLVRNLEAQGVEYVFGIPGAKIDPVFDALLDSKIKTVVCRHEQNAAFIAGGLGRITGKAGVVLVTSGPGCSNLVTGLATANTEGDPIVALGGAVPVDRTAEADPPEHGHDRIVPARHQVCGRDRFGRRDLGGGGGRVPRRRSGTPRGCVPQPAQGRHECRGIGRRAHAGAQSGAGRGRRRRDRRSRAPDRLGRATHRAARHAGQPAGGRGGGTRRCWAAPSLPLPAPTRRRACCRASISIASRDGSACSTTSPPTACSMPPTSCVTIGFDPVEYDPALWNRGKVAQAHPSRLRAGRPRPRLSARHRADG